MKCGRHSFPLTSQKAECIKQKIISVNLLESMIKAVGFRNLVVHEYARLDLKQVYKMATNGINDLEAFIGTIVRRFA